MAENRLSKESSLYLQQHANNPVDWWPWCDEAFELAEKEGKPVLISIGYSSCHWCHVMAHECFEDDYIANMMNRMFVNIKVDREERPDVDQIYMEAVQMFNQQGGWPLNVFCFPNKRPFMGGTYFPPEDRGHGVVPWPHLLVRVAEAFKVDRVQLETNADAITSNLEYLSGSIVDEDRDWDVSILIDGAERICESLDLQYGGFGSAPKFPPSQMLGYLYAVGSPEFDSKKHEQLSGNVDQALQLSSHALVRGGLYDHVGGGFFRYSVDEQWRVPHFEKMLYDNALILETLCKIWSRNRWDGLVHPIEKTVEWLHREFSVGKGRYASALDADSDEGEGAYYLWSESQLKESISSVQSSAFCKAFSISGEDSLNLYPWSIDDEAYLNYHSILDDLRDIREQRSKPVLDEKVLLAWNALMYRSLSVGAQVFGRPDWLLKAQEGLDWAWETMLTDGELVSVFYSNDVSSQGAYLDDYVNFALANIHFGAVCDGLERGLSQCYYDRAKQLADFVIEKFLDGKGEGFFFCSEDGAKDLIVRKKEWFDNAIPSGNSSVVHLFSYLQILYDNSVYRELLAELKTAYVEKARRMPNGVAFGLEGFAWESIGIVSIKYGASVNVAEVLSALRLKSWRPFVLQFESQLPESQMQLCIGTVCYQPSSDLSDITARL